MFCKKCGENIDDDSKFCSYCGEKVEIKKEIESSKGKQNSENEISDENISLNKKEIPEDDKIEQTIENVNLDENISFEIKEKSEKENIKTFSQFFYSHEGSIGAKEFFFRGFLPLTMLLVFSITSYLITSAAGQTNDSFKFLSYAVIVFWFFIFLLVANVSVKRLHDANVSGSWALLNLIPLLNLFLLLFLFLAPSKKDNIYGLKSKYDLDLKNILLSIFYVVMTFILLVTHGVSKVIIEQTVSDNLHKSSNYQEKNSNQNTENKSDDFNEILKLAEKGDVESQLKVADKYFFTTSTNQNYYEALKWYEKAAIQGNPKAQYMVGVFYNDGTEVVQDYFKAFGWFEKAANQGHMRSQYLVGKFYENGTGVTQNYFKAIEWYEKAANQGDLEARFNIGLLYSEGKPIKDYYKALESYEIASVGGHIGSQYNLGIMYYNAEGVKQDYFTAKYFFEKAANQNDGMAQTMLGIMHYDGKGVRQDIKLAKEWFGKACDNGDQKGCDAYKELTKRGF